MGVIVADDFQEIEFTIKKDGSVEYTIRGIKGASCDDVSKVFETLGRVDESKKTREYYEKEADVKILTQRK